MHLKTVTEQENEDTNRNHFTFQDVKEEHYDVSPVNIDSNRDKVFATSQMNSTKNAKLSEVTPSVRESAKWSESEAKVNITQEVYDSDYEKELEVPSQLANPDLSDTESDSSEKMIAKKNGQ